MCSDYVGLNFILFYVVVDASFPHVVPVQCRWRRAVWVQAGSNGENGRADVKPMARYVCIAGPDYDT